MRTQYLPIATATAANKPGLHNNRISAQTVLNRLRENGLHAWGEGSVMVRAAIADGYRSALVVIDNN